MASFGILVTILNQINVVLVDMAYRIVWCVSWCKVIMDTNGNLLTLLLHYGLV